MATTTETWSGRTALLAAHCAGMIDLVSLPVWVSTLISAYKFDPQQAGALPTIFLVAAVIASVVSAPRFNHVNRRLCTTGGFAIAAVAFVFASTQTSFGALAVAHIIGGLGVGTALSFAHGTIGRSENPHRLYAYAGTALGLFAVLFLGATPTIVAHVGGSALFQIFAGVMLIAALLCAALFPAPFNGTVVEETAAQQGLGRKVWAVILGISFMLITQAMVFSFLQQIGVDRGFGIEAVAGVLIGAGTVNLLPAPLAVLFERRIPAQVVIMLGATVQAVLALLVTMSVTFTLYAAGGTLLSAVVIFTHTFAFGLLSRLDTTGRALAATPAMLMIGSAVGPFLGGTLAKFYGYPAIGVVACIFALIALVFFSQARARREALTVPAAS